jgi:hypothetical protein
MKIALMITSVLTPRHCEERSNLKIAINFSSIIFLPLFEGKKWQKPF